MQALLEFVDAQVEFFKQAIDIAEQMRVRILDSSIKGDRVKRQQKFKRAPSAASISNQSTPARSSSQDLNNNESSNGGAASLVVPLSAASVSSSRQQTSDNLGSMNAVNSQYHTPMGSIAQLDTPIAKPPRPGAPRKLVRANFSFMAENKDELSINKGDVITVINEIDQGWWIGEANGKRGMFPAK